MIKPALCLVISLILAVPSSAVADALVETFDGNGEFNDVTNRTNGFDLSGWSVFSSDWDVTGDKTLDGVFTFAATGKPGFGGHSETLILGDLQWDGSFVQRVEVRDFSIAATDEGGREEARLLFEFSFDLADPRQKSLAMCLCATNSISLPNISVIGGDEGIEGFLRGWTPTDNFSFEIIYHKQLSLAEFRYDDDIDDTIPSVELNLDKLENINIGHRSVKLFVNALGSGASVSAALDHFSMRSLVPGDFNYDEVFDFHDLAILADDIGTNEPRRDLNKDSVVDLLDTDIWLHDMAMTYYGDANLDGEFNTSDLVRVFNAAEYEDAVDDNSTWETGDWNLDGDFTTSDLVLAFKDGGFEKGPRVAAAIVPEPTTPSSIALMLSALFLTRSRRSRRLSRDGS
ncbi:MAG: hypothetical protein KDB27_01290 [Planctomycetales bacterium]|nr:hypothetical protein [Planctomycetales bacterium]